MRTVICKSLLTTFAFAVMFCTDSTLSMSAKEVAEKKPHVILIVADDLGWSDVSWNNPNVVMPHMDTLAKNGVILNQSYVQPTCTPTRAALLTGRYPFKLGLQKAVIAATEPAGLSVHVDILPQLLKKVNYETHAIGKWHLGFCSWDYTPTKRGFDSFYGFYTGAADYYTHKRSTSVKLPEDKARRDHDGGFLDLRNNTTPDDTKDGVYSTHLFASVAEDIVRSRKPQDPLFMYLAFQSVHSPIQVPQNYSQVYEHIQDQDRRNYLGMVTAMDEAIGRLVTALKETGHYNNSVIIFTTDNGGSVKNSGSNWPLRGEKSSLWEGGVRGVAFIHSPFLPNPGTVTNQLHHATDWFRTIIDITGGPTAEVDGVSQWDAFAGVSGPPRDKMIYNMYDLEGFKAGVRLGDYKMLIGRMTRNSWASSPPSADSPVQGRHKASHKIRRQAWPKRRLPAIFLAKKNKELTGGETPLNDTYESFFSEPIINKFNDFDILKEDSSEDFTPRNRRVFRKNKGKGRKDKEQHILWRDLKNHPDLVWHAEELQILEQHMEDKNRIRLFNIKDDPEERNSLSTTKIHELQAMFNYLFTQLQYMKSIPANVKVKAGHPVNWNDVWSPGWCQATF
ncbi:arylsulfatase B-like [Macrobrachium rosenbergii]|uniref:arylsulfatase B-like n=1 Tax=Macrobrachium rosenbergii TaxID=79674 RepID=UPI0034D5096F